MDAEVGKLLRFVAVEIVGYNGVRHGVDLLLGMKKRRFRVPARGRDSAVCAWYLILGYKTSLSAVQKTKNIGLKKVSLNAFIVQSR